MNKGQKDGEPSKTWPKLSLISEQDQKSIKIAIKRSHMPVSSSESPLERIIQSPERLKIHITDRTFRPLLERDDVCVNQGGHDVCYGIRRRPNNRGRSNSPTSNADTTTEIRTKCKHYPIFKNNYTNCRPPFPLPPEEDKYTKKKSDEAHYPSTSYRHESGGHNHRHSSPKYDYGSSKRKRSPSYEHRKARRRSPSPYSKSSKSYEKPERKYYPASPETRRSRSPIRPRRSPSHERRRAHSPLRPGEYRPRLNERRRSQSPLKPGEYRPRPSPEKRRTPVKSEYRIERRSTSRERRRSRSPHRRSSSRERRRDSRSPPLRPGEYRPPKRQQAEPRHYEMPRHSSDYVFYEGDYTALLRPPLMPRFMPPPRGMLRPGHILVPHVQYIPVPHIPPIRPQFIRPPKIYNNRVIPRLVTPPRTTTATTSTITSTTNTAAANNSCVEDDKAKVEKD